MSEFQTYKGWFYKASPIQPWNDGPVKWKVAAGRKSGRPMTYLKNSKGRVARFDNQQAALEAMCDAIDTRKIEEKDTR